MYWGAGSTLGLICSVAWFHLYSLPLIRQSDKKTAFSSLPGEWTRDCDTAMPGTSTGLRPRRSKFFYDNKPIIFFIGHFYFVTWSNYGRKSWTVEIICIGCFRKKNIASSLSQPAASVEWVWTTAVPDQALYYFMSWKVRRWSKSPSGPYHLDQSPPCFQVSIRHSHVVW